ncbi:MAG: hypothetical protein DIZ80_08105 [endosymbiont of Galathealinum brachiosum]|uniref:Uncharacterized protein n=1 Tax=endosymbiont of Galathealinum brachiosum TaxID=2200906 RepID=A0A370DGN1_9GAMM|nr:MAG: hypothetical protein DIZ80_08105 [endosymbiont of Galathealinum brachiosum]
MKENESQLEQPKGIKLNRKAEELIITRTWFTISSVIILAAITGYFDVMIYQKADVPLLISNFQHQFQWYMLIPVIAIGGLHYALLVSLLNKTSIRITPYELSIKHFPIPFPGSMNILSENISQIFCTREESSSMSDSAGRKVKFYLNVKMNNDAIQKLLTVQSSATQILFMEQEIENFLGIEDVFVDDVENQLARNKEKHIRKTEEEKWVYSGTNKIIENNQLGIRFQVPDNLDAEVCKVEDPFKGGFIQAARNWEPLNDDDNWSLFRAKAPGILGLALTVGQRPAHGSTYEEVMDSTSAKVLMEPVSSVPDFELNGLKGFSVTRKIKNNPLYIRQVWLFDNNKQYHLQMDILEGDKVAHEVATTFESSFKLLDS